MLVGIIVEEGWTSTACIFKVTVWRRPDLTRAWNPLQIPMIKPPRSMKLSIAARTFSLSKMLTINLAAPSGSSAAEKPPARKIMLAFQYYQPW